MTPRVRNAPQKRRRRLLGLEPFFGGGWLHKGSRARRWDVEHDLVALALFGDVTVDLAHARSTPADVTIRAWALFRDVDIVVARDTRVEITGGGVRGDVSSTVAEIPLASARTRLHVEGHTLTADVTVRLVSDSRSQR